MAVLKDKRDPLHLAGRRLVLLLLALLVLSAAWQVWNVWQKERESAQLAHDAQAKLANLEAQQTKLQTDYDSLQTERGMEAALRQEYAMGKPGEGMVVIIEPQAIEPAAASSTLLDWLKAMWSRL